LTLTNACSQPGSEVTGTNALDRKVSGNKIIIDMPCTARALLAIAPITPSAPPPGR
jgi:hypothetical protein